jgi:hypothetical protein
MEKEKNTYTEAKENLGKVYDELMAEDLSKKITEIEQATTRLHSPGN